MDYLLKALKAISQAKVTSREQAPIWFSERARPFRSAIRHNRLPRVPAGISSRTFGPISALNTTECIYCGVSIQYAVATAHPFDVAHSAPAGSKRRPGATS